MKKTFNADITVTIENPDEITENQAEGLIRDALNLNSNIESEMVQRVKEVE